nr:MAG TPA: hypothetical protein [Caudoviricetes sp.]
MVLTKYRIDSILRTAKVGLLISTRDRLEIL